MFSYDDKHKIQYFGEWAEDGIFRSFTCKALAICKDAVARCYDEDMRREADLAKALDFIRRQSARPVMADRFRRALDIEDAGQRFKAARKAYEALARGLGAE